MTTPSYEELYEQAPCGHLSTLADGTVIAVNQSFLAMTGYRRADVLGRDFPALLSAGSRLFYETRCLPVLQLEGEVHEVALTLTRADGSALSVIVNSVLRPPAQEQPPLIHVAAFDSTGRRDYERDLLGARRDAELSERRARVLQEASTALGACESEDSLASTLATCAGQAFDATHTAVVLMDDGSPRLLAGTHPGGTGRVLDPDGPEAEALRSGEVVTLGDLEAVRRRFPTLVEPLVASRLEAVSVAPLPGGDSPLGFVACFFGRRREFDDDARVLHAALASYASQVLRRIRLQNTLEQLAMHDQLTGLANRELLRRRLHQALSSAERHHTPVALVFVDLDGFKAVNDHLGHGAGDSVLEQVADRLRQVVRGGDTVARYGGDEFVVVCANTDGDAAARVAERMRLAVLQPLFGVPSTLRVSASIGVVLHHPDGGMPATAESLLRRADDAMYASKRRGKDRSTIVRA